MDTQVLRNSGELLTVTFTVDGVPTDADADDVSVTVTRDDGTAIDTNAATTPGTTGVYGYPLAPSASLDHLTVVWTGVFSGITQSITTYVDIVGGYYVSLAELRALPNLSDTTKFPNADLIEARQWFETLAERHCKQAFVPRYKRQRHSGDGSTTLLVDMNPITVQSVRDYTDAATYTSFTADELADIDVDPIGRLTRLTLGAWRRGSRNLDVAIEHGMTSCPDDLRSAAKIAIREHLLNDTTGRPMLSVADGAGGTTRFAMPGPGRPTGIPDVDVILNGYRLLSVA